MAEQRVTIRLTGDNANLLASLRTSSSAVEQLKTNVQQLDRELERAGTRDIKVRATLESATLQAELQRLARENVKVQVGIKTDLDTSGWQAQATAAAAAIRININADLDTTAAEAALTLLARRRQATVDVNLNSAAARTQLGALTRTQNVNLRPNVDGGFLSGVKREIDAALGQISDRPLVLVRSDDDRKIAALRAELERIRDTQLNVGMDAAPALTRIQQISDELHKLSGESARIDVKADTAAAGAKLDEIERRVDRLNGKDAEVDVKTRQTPTAPGVSGGSGLGLLSGVAGSAGLLVSLLPQAVSLLSSAAAEATAIAGQLGLAASAGAGLLPVVGALGQGLGTAKLATAGVADALKAYSAEKASGSAASMQKLNDALAKLGPNQRAFVTEAVRAQVALDGLRKSTGEALFAGMNTTLRTATTTLLPLFQAQLTDTAGILNRTGKGVVGQLAGPLKGELAGALRLNNDLLLRASPLAGHLVSGFLALYTAVGPLARRIVDAAAGLGKVSDEALQAGVQSGKLTAFFDRAGDRAANLLKGVGNLALGFKNVFIIGNEGSAGLLPGFQSLTERFRDFTTSVSGETKLRKWFDDGRAAGKQLIGLLGDVKREFGGITANTNAAGIIGRLREAVPYVANLVKTLSGSGNTGHVLAASLLEVAQALQQMNAGGLLTTFVGTLAGMVTGISEAIRTVPGLAPILGALASAAGGLLAFKLVLGPVMGLAGALRNLGTSAAGASSAKLALGGVGAAVAIGTLLWGVYRQEQQRTKQAVDDVNQAISSGSVDALKSSEDQVRKTLKATQDLQNTNDNRSALQRAGHLLDAYRASSDEWTGAIGKQQAALRKAEDATRAYNTNVVQYQQTSGNAYGATVTLTQAQQLFADAGVKVGDSYQQARQKVSDYNRENGSAAQATRDLAKDMDTLSNSTSSAADKADALKRVLEGISGGAEDVQKSTIAYKEAIDAVTASVAENGKGLDDNTARGRANGQAILAAKDALYDHLAAMAKNGATQDELKAKLDEGTAALGASLTATGATKDEVARYQQVLGLTPAQKATELQVLGDVAATGKITALQGAIDALHGKDLILQVMANTGNMNSNVGSGGANGYVMDFYAQGGLRTPGKESHVAQFAKAGDWRVWAEPETGGESYIPLAPSKRERSTRIWRETGKRLGVHGFADGGIRVNETADTAGAITGLAPAVIAAARSVTRAMQSVGFGGSGVAPTGRNVLDVWRNLRSQGFSPAQAAGVMGNIQSESGFDPFIVQGGGHSMNPAAAGHGGYGLVQWTPGSKLIPFLHGQAPSVASEIAALAEQLRTTERAAGAALSGATDPVTAANVFGLRYERYAGPPQAARARQAAAFYDQYKAMANGGVMAPAGSVLNPHVRDQGGPLLPGFTFNGTGAPERVEMVRSPVGPDYGSWVRGSGSSGGGQVTTTVRHEYALKVDHVTDDSAARAVSGRVQKDVGRELALAGLRVNR